MPTPGRFRLGVDIGGTFTDLILIDDQTGRHAVAKTLTSPEDPSLAVQRGVAALLAAQGVPAADLHQVIHGTTLVTNAIIERKGAPTALITTRGFRDALEIAREHRYDVYDLFIERPEPLVPRHLRFEIGERMLADGRVHEPPRLAEVAEIVAALRRQGVAAVAVCLLHSHRNPAHERAIAASLADLAPELYVSLSAEVHGQIGEYERASTAVANVYVRPLVDRYLAQLAHELEGLGFAGRLFIMLSSGGICTLDTARRFPIRLVESGPAAGALAAAHYRRLAGYRHLLSFDMGGTTAKACLIDAGQPLTSGSFEVARVYRFKRGSGLPVRVPVIEMIEIGAGGGSIARVDRFGLLKVGPDSAGAAPGPACYGLGGAEPTVTDADLLLGYLDPAFFLGGEMSLDRAAAERAVGGIAAGLGVDLLSAAWGIHRVVNENMATAARMHAVERGKDLRAYPLFAFGGAGPVHAYRVAEILRAPLLICPFGAGATSTLGLLTAPLAFDFLRSRYAPIDALDWPAINALLAEMDAEGRTLLRGSGLAEREISIQRSCDMRYLGQGHEIPVPLPDGPLDAGSLPVLVAAFDAVYRRMYGRTVPGAPIETLHWRLVAAGPTPGLPAIGAPVAAGGAARALKGERPAYFPEHGGYHPTPVYDRYRLAPGDSFAGPAIVEERESTVVVGPRGLATISPDLNLVVRFADEQQ